MHYVTLLSFIFFSGLVAMATWLVVRKKESNTVDGFFLAGRSLTFPFIAGSMLLTNLSTEQLVGLNGAAYMEGLMVFSWEIMATITLVLLGCFFLPHYLKHGVTTLPQFLGKCFGDSTAAICNFIFLLFYTFGLLPTILYTGATGLNGIIDMKALTGIPDDEILLWGMIVFVGFLGAIYALFGGLRTVAASDFFNGIGLLTGGFMIFFFALDKAGAGSGVWAGLQKVVTFAPEKFHSIGSSTSSLPFSTLFTGVLIINAYYWCTNQQIIQRALAAKSLAEGQKGVFLCGLLKLLGPIYLVLPGIIAFYFFSTDGIKGDQAYGLLVRKVLPAPLAGFFAAVMVGAILSSFNSVLNSTCTMFSLGPYKMFLNRNATEKQVVASGKYFGWAVAIMAMFVAPYLARTASIFSFLRMLDAIVSTPLLAVTLIAITCKRVPTWAANCVLVGGVLVSAICLFIHIPISSYHVAGIIFLVVMAFMLTAGKLFPAPVKAEPEAVVDLNPWKWAKLVGIALILAVLTLYVILR